MRKLFILVLAGAALTALGDASAARSNTTWSSNWFQSPTGNIRCRYFGNAVACTTLNNGRVAVVPVTGNAYSGHYNYSFPGGPILSYGQYYNAGGRFRCLSRSDGVFCISLVSGRGFGIAREFVRTF